MSMKSLTMTLKPKIPCDSTVSILLLTVVGYWILPVENARILAVETIPGKSPWNVMSSILRVLSDNGHHVTVFTPFPDGDRKNYKEVSTFSDFPYVLLDYNASEILKNWSNPISMIELTRVSYRKYCNDIMYENVQLKAIMQNNGRSNFDLVIVESIGRNCVSYLATKLNLPLIHVITSPMETFVERSIIGHVPNPATISHIYANHAVPKTFFQRLSNTALLAYTMLAISCDEWIQMHFNPKPHNLITNLVKPSVIFVNSHYISESSRAFPPNVIQVGGIHLQPVKSIPNVSRTILVNFQLIYLIKYDNNSGI